jgi:hypothetical protein
MQYSKYLAYPKTSFGPVMAPFLELLLILGNGTSVFPTTVSPNLEIMKLFWLSGAPMSKETLILPMVRTAVLLK